MSTVLPSKTPSANTQPSPAADPHTVEELKQEFVDVCAATFDKWLPPEGQLWGSHLTEMEEELQRQLVRLSGGR